jgi:adenylate kinase family enzyme
MDRILIVGPFGAGKSTLAERLSSSSGIPRFELDTLRYHGNWDLTPPNEFLKAILDITAQDSWIIDGNSRSAGEILWTRATVIIWLDLSLAVVMARVLSRTIRRLRSHIVFNNGQQESLKRAFLSRNAVVVKCIISWNLWRSEYRRRCLDWKKLGIVVFQLKSQRQIDEAFRGLVLQNGYADMSSPGEFKKPAASPNQKQGVVHKSKIGWDLVLALDANKVPQLFFRADDMLMFDWDNCPEKECVTALENLIHSLGRKALFRLYKTVNGFHAFLVSEPCNARRVETVKWTSACKADAKYAWMSFARGHFDVRLSAKQDNDKICEFVREIGAAKADARLSKVMLCHDMIAAWSRDVAGSSWRSSQDIDWFAMLNGVCDGLTEAIAAIR